MSLAERYDDVVLDDPTFSVADRLRKARVSAGLDQTEMASKIGVSRPTVSAWERGRSEPNVTQAARWAAVTGVSFGWLANVSVRNRCFSVVPPVLGQNELPFEVDRQLASVNA